MWKNEKKTNDIKEFEKNQAIFVEVVAKPTTFVPRDEEDEEEAVDISTPMRFF